MKETICQKRRNESIVHFMDNYQDHTKTKALTTKLFIFWIMISKEVNEENK